MTDDEIRQWADCANIRTYDDSIVTKLRRFAALARADVERERDALQARVAELEKDARRYRWLRDGGAFIAPSLWNDGIGFCRPELKRARVNKLAGIEIDAAIDAALDHKETP